jgi:hypothetical protein
VCVLKTLKEENFFIYYINALLSLLKIRLFQALVAHTCNPSYSGGRDQEDHGLNPALGNSSGDPISKNPSQK